MALQILLLVVGLALLVKGGELFVSAAVRLTYSFYLCALVLLAAGLKK